MRTNGTADRADVGALLQDNYAKGVVPAFGLMDPLAALFKRMRKGRYQISGKKLVITTDVFTAGSGQATDGSLPAHNEAAPVALETVPARRYVSSRLDNFIAALTRGPGAAEDYLNRLKRQHLEQFEAMETRHINGSTTGTLCKVTARISATVISVEDGYGYNGQPVTGVVGKIILTVLDASNAFAPLGAARVQSYDPVTKRITFTAPIDDGATVVAAGDPVVMATRTDTDHEYFCSERGLAPLGALDIMDPLSANASYMGQPEATATRLTPYRKESTAFDDMEIMRWLQGIKAHGNVAVTPSTHTLSTHDGVVTKLAEVITEGHQFQGVKGKTLNGGYETVRIANQDFLQTSWHIWDCIFAWHEESLHRVHLGDEFGDVAEDGSVYSRLDGFDGREWYGRDYMQTFADRRNTMGVLYGCDNPYAEEMSGVHNVA